MSCRSGHLNDMLKAMIHAGLRIDRCEGVK